MPINIPKQLPAREILNKEKIFVRDAERATTQDIRPLNIAILNIMPEKEKTELQLLRLLGNTPLQVNITFLHTATHLSKNVSKSHLDTFYTTFEEIKDRRFDGMIITGDRKSTRLNSSHVAISYAVFCLKKKINTAVTTHTTTTTKPH